MGIFMKALGFESENSEPKQKKKVKKAPSKASFNLKKDKIEKPDKIDGVKVIYVEENEQCYRALDYLKADEPVLLNFEQADDKSRCLGFFEGIEQGFKCKFMEIDKKKELYILLPEGVEIE